MERGTKSAVRGIAPGLAICQDAALPDDKVDHGRTHVLAATRPADCWLTISRDWVIADCGDGVPAIIEQSIGMTVWEAFPNSETVFRPIYDKAWRDGMAAGLTYYNNVLAEILVFLRDDHLLVSFRSMTVAELRASVERYADEPVFLEALRAEWTRPRLRLVQ